MPCPLVGARCEAAAAIKKVSGAGDDYYRILGT